MNNNINSKYEKQLKALGKRIVEIRKEKGLSQRQLSDLLDMDDGSLRRIESGRTNPTTITLIRISEASGVSLAEFFSKGIE